MERSGELRTKRDIFQLGRRNLTDAQKTYLIGRQYEAQKMTTKNAGGHNQYTRREVIAQNGPKPKDTAETIAKEHNIGRNTVKRAEKFVKGVDAAEKINSGTQKVKNRPRCCSTEDGYRGQQTDSLLPSNHNKCRRKKQCQEKQIRAPRRAQAASGSGLTVDGKRV